MCVSGVGKWEMNGWMCVSRVGKWERKVTESVVHDHWANPVILCCSGTPIYIYIMDIIIYTTPSRNKVYIQVM